MKKHIAIILCGLFIAILVAGVVIYMTMIPSKKDPKIDEASCEAGTYYSHDLNSCEACPETKYCEFGL